MAVIPIKCSLCDCSQVVKFGINRQKKQSYQCRNTQCAKNTSILNYSNKAYLPETVGRIIDMTLNGSSIRDIFPVCWGSASTPFRFIRVKKRAVASKHKPFITGVKGVHS